MVVASERLGMHARVALSVPNFGVTPLTNRTIKYHFSDHMMPADPTLRHTARWLGLSWSAAVAPAAACSMDLLFPCSTLPG